MTNNDIAVGEAALTAYVKRVEGFKAYFVPEAAERDGAIMVIKAWNAVGQADNSDAEALKRANCGMALYRAIVKAGYGSDVTPTQCAEAANEVVAAVLKARGSAPAAKA